MILPPPRILSPSHQRFLGISPRPSLLHRRPKPHLSPPLEIESKDIAPTFACFRKLPPEIRVKIWDIALRPRLITIIPSLNRDAAICEVVVEAQRIELLYVCHESREEALRNYHQIRLNGNNGGTTFINWSRDIIFLDIPDGSVDIDSIMGLLDTSLQSVQTLAIRMRAHVFWGFPQFLRGASHLQKLIFVDELEREPLPLGLNGHLYLMDLGPLGFIRGCNVDPYGEYRYFQEDIWIKLLECYQDELFDVVQWEMPLKTISWVRDLNNKGERYCLLLPVT